MKTAVQISRVLVGALFIFSGLVKAIDPSGLAYKMQEFFEAWGGFFVKLNDYALPFSLVMITAEIVLGVALLLGVYRKLTIWLLLLLMLLFTFLTAYVFFSGKIRACGCFGDCIPLTPVQTLTKDIVLLALCLLLLMGYRHIKPLFNRAWVAVLIALLAAGYLQYHVLRHLPLVDCLPYKKGNNLIEQMKPPADATFDKFEYTFFYKKDGAEKEFTLAETPDSTWAFVKQGSKKLVSKGNGKTAPISGFSFTTEYSNDTTDAILNQTGSYYLMLARDAPKNANPKWAADFAAILKKTGKPGYYVTANPIELRKKLPGNEVPVFACDAIALKTAARVYPTLYLMNGPVVQQKWAGIDIDKLTQ